jgi:DNA-binding transcriptional LysR family regulator
MPNANDLLIFAKAVDCGGFSAAARQLGFPRSTVSKRVAELEASLGVRLVHRNARSFVLTEVGRDVYEHARAASAEVDGARSAARRRMEEPSGTVRMTVPVAMLHFELAQKLTILLERHPRLHVSVHATDSFVDIVKDGFDIAVRSHFAPLADSGLVQRVMRVEPLILVTSPIYIARKGEPAHPTDLLDHQALPGGMTCTTWHLRNTAGELQSVTPHAQVTVDEAFALVNAAVAGLGITILPQSYCRAELEAGRLVHIMRDWSAGPFTTTVLTPHRSGQLPSVRAVANFLAGM